MPSYKYMARDERGNAVNGMLVAPSPDVLAERLKRMGYLITQVRELHEGSHVDTFIQRLRPVGHDDVVLFNVQLAKMVQVGIPLVTTLETLMQQTENVRLRGVITDVARSVEGGEGFSEALRHHPSVFSPLFVSMVRAGEISGKLDEILRRLAIFAKHEAEVRQQVKTAMTYPMVLLVFGVGVTIFLLAGIIPKFMKIFLEAHVPLPLPTRMLYGASQFICHYGIALAGALTVAALGCWQYVRTPLGRRQADHLVLKLPVLGGLIRKAALSRLARTLETLFSSGVPVLEALAIAEQTCGNAVIADVCRMVQTSVKQGRTLSEPMRASGEFPPMVTQMVSVGESSGTLDHMLVEIAEHYDELIGHELKRLTTFIEPIFLVLMGGLVALIMASVLLPLFRMVNVIH